MDDVSEWCQIRQLHDPTLCGSNRGPLYQKNKKGRHWGRIPPPRWLPPRAHAEETPKDMPQGGTVNVIDLSAHGAGRAHIAVYRYRENDFRSYIF